MNTTDRYCGHEEKQGFKSGVAVYKKKYEQ